MPFPFLPVGAAVAASVLLAALTAFGLILRAMDRAVIGLRDTVLSGLVTGMRTWSSRRPDRLGVDSPRSSSESPWAAPDEPRSTLRPVMTATPPAPELIDLGSRTVDRELVGRR